MSRVARSLGLTTALADVALLVAAYFGAYEVRYHLQLFPGVYNWDRYALLVVVAAPVFLSTAALAGLYQGGRRALVRELGALLAASAMTGTVLAALAFLLKQQHQSRPLVVLFMALAFALTALLRLAARVLSLGSPERVERVLIVGSGAEVAGIVRSVRRRRRTVLVGAVTEDEGADAGEGVPVLGTLEQFEVVLRREVVDEVIFAVPRSRFAQVEAAFAIAEDLGLDTKLCLTFLPHRISRIDFEELDGTPVLSFTTAPAHPVALALKRVFDLTIAGLALLVCAPLFAGLAIAIKATMPGPVFFRQKRSGLNGREFWMLKFRSMVVDAESRLADLQSKNEMDGPVFKLKEDPRVTPLGRFLRKSSIDELPQFINVFLGDMSVVGPRPPLPAEVAKYERWQRRRLSVKPGITCIWQISGRNEIDFETWMKLDLAYIDEWSLWLDLKIFLKTIPVVLLGRGAR